MKGNDMSHGVISDGSGNVQSSKEMDKNSKEVLEYFFEKTDGMDISMISSILAVALAKMFLVLEENCGDNFSEFSEDFLKLTESKVMQIKKGYEWVH